MFAKYQNDSNIFTDIRVILTILILDSAKKSDLPPSELASKLGLTKSFSLGKRMKALMSGFKLKEFRSLLKNEAVRALFQIYKQYGHNSIHTPGEEFYEALCEALEDILAQRIVGGGTISAKQ